MLSPLKRFVPPDCIRWSIFFSILLIALFTACPKPPAPDIETILRAQPPAQLPAHSLLQPAVRPGSPSAADLLLRRVNLLGQIRTALALAPAQTLPLVLPSEPQPPCSIRFALGLLPQYWERHPQPVNFQMVAGDKTLWEQTLAPARDLEQRSWQEVTLACEAVPGQSAELKSDARDYGALVTPLQVSRPGPRPSVIFILVDAMRPDHLGAYGYSRPTSPHLDTLAASGVRFENAITASVFTLTSVASIFTGRYPWEHGVIFTRNLHLPTSLPVLAQEFQKQGYFTAAFSGTYFRFSLEGFDRGFQVFDESCAQAFFRDSADCLNRAALPWLQAHAHQPFFLYLHYVDTHAPYYAPEPFRHLFTQGHRPDHDAAGLGDAARFGDGRKWYQVPFRLTPADLEYMKDLYDGEIAYADARIGEILDLLRQSGQMNSTLILVTADHGESFTEHGELEHRKTLYDEALKVPLILAGPGLPAGKVIADQVRTLDFGATLLGLAFSDRIILGEGRSLKPLGEGLPLAPVFDPEAPFGLSSRPKADRREPALAAAYLGKEQRIYALRTLERKLIVRHAKPQVELYDLRQDPGEQHDLSRLNPLERETLFRQLQSLCPEVRYSGEQ